MRTDIHLVNFGQIIIKKIKNKGYLNFIKHVIYNQRFPTVVGITSLEPKKKGKEMEKGKIR